MNKQKERFAIVGLARSGMAVLEFLYQQANPVLIFDQNATWDNKQLEEIQSMGEFHPGSNPTGEEMVDKVILSPGISTSKDFVQRFIQRGIPVIGEIEFAYTWAKGYFVGITGTNGKTTVTTWVNELFLRACLDSRVGGNIGVPLISKVGSSTENTWFPTEISSFQLETVKDFRCHIACITNLSEDHLDRHGSMEEYRRIKEHIFINQTSEDFAIVNYQEGYDYHSELTGNGKRILISTKEALDSGVYCKDGIIQARFQGKTTEICPRGNLFLKGEHNLENALFVAAIGLCAGISHGTIKETLESFQGVEHRLQYVDTIGNVSYYNDSKATNPNAAIQALSSFDQGVILIAGGYDKHLDFRPWIKTFGQKVKTLILMGQCAAEIQRVANEEGVEHIIRVSSMEEAVQKAYSLGQEGDTVLLSPACASLDIYSSFEERGKDFILQVKGLNLNKDR